MGTLVNLTVHAPGFAGLNTQSSLVSGLQWAQKADNVVLDKQGRLAARQGIKQITSSPLSGAPAVRSVFEHIAADGTSVLFSAAGNKLYSGTAALTERTGTAGSNLGITADHWQFQSIAGYCIGFQAGHDPIESTGANFGLLQQKITPWTANTAVSVGEVRRAVATLKGLYFRCSTAGTTGGAEPSWNTSVGGATTDGTAVWITEAMPTGNVCHAAFGRLWVASAPNSQVLEFSDLLLPWRFRGGSAGYIDLRTVWGYDRITAIASLENLLVIFGERHILLYSDPHSPASMALSEKITGVGCIARDSVVSIGQDLLFLDTSGLMSLSRALQGGRQPLSYLTRNVRDALLTDLLAESRANLKAVYSPSNGFYALFCTGTKKAWIVDLRYPNPDDSPKITTWRDVTINSAVETRIGSLYFGGAGVISEYSGYLDGTGSPYQIAYESTWTTFGDADPNGFLGVASRLKFPKVWRVRVDTSASYTFTGTIGYDYRYERHSAQQQLNVGGTRSEWGVMQWGLDEWFGGTALQEAALHPKASGRVLAIGFKTNINGSALAVQDITLAVKLGRLAH